MGHRQALTDTQHMSNDKLQVNDRVKRKSGQGGAGVVKEIRKEIQNPSAAVKKEDGMLMVLVLWDNGTQSYFSPEGLERA